VTSSKSKNHLFLPTIFVLWKLTLNDCWNMEQLQDQEGKKTNKNNWINSRNKVGNYCTSCDLMNLHQQLQQHEAIRKKQHLQNNIGLQPMKKNLKLVLKIRATNRWWVVRRILLII
jgi:hypothetical protein